MCRAARIQSIFAYEPVWAIGEGVTSADPATPMPAKQINSVAAGCLCVEPPCLYGGSVNADNCTGLIVRPHIEGLFIGRAAWRPDGYIDILKRGLADL